MLIVGDCERFLGCPGKDKIGYCGMIDGSGIGSGSTIDLTTDPEGGFAHFKARALISHDCGIKGVTGYDDGIIPDLRMPLGAGEHKGGKDNERVRSSY